MASITARKNKQGKITSFTIFVYKGRDANGKQLKPYTTSYRVEKGMTERQARKAAEEYAILFEKQIKDGIVNSNQTYEEYSGYVIDLKIRRGLIKISTADRYLDINKRIITQIGHLKLHKITPEHLNRLYDWLAEPSQNKRNKQGLSAKTILEHHRLISTVLKNAVKEGILLKNVAEQATPPKYTQQEVNYFQPQDIERIKQAANQENIKWKTMIYLLISTGCRRGEILGLTWDNVFLDKDKIYICNNMQYSPKKGIYEDTPKTKKSIRYITIPQTMVDILTEYKEQCNHKYLFTQKNGDLMHPDSITDYLTKFSKKYGLPYINAHAFRHTMASILYFNGIDSISISNRLGHAQPSTTVNIPYRHTTKSRPISTITS